MTKPQSQDEETTSTPENEASQSSAGGNSDENTGAGQQVAELKDQLLRALAEAENTRRRAQKEREDTAKYAVANFAREMLSVADNFPVRSRRFPKTPPIPP